MILIKIQVRVKRVGAENTRTMTLAYHFMMQNTKINFTIQFLTQVFQKPYYPIKSVLSWMGKTTNQSNWIWSTC
jgi:hypothetical protein